MSLISIHQMYYSCQAQATTEESSDYYKDAVSFLKAINSESSFNLGVTVGVYDVEVGLEGGFENSFIHNISQYTNKVMAAYTCI